jgi:hypothetical protein
VNWIGVAQSRDQRRSLVNMVMSLWVGYIECGEVVKWLHDSWPLE